MKQSRISKLRDKRSQLSDDDWENILLSSLLYRRIPKADANPVEKLEMVATIAGDVLAIQFRNNISGITQKLGELLLKQDEGQEIDAISWCGTAVQRSTSLDAEVQDLSAKYDEQSKTIEQLNQQLEELIDAKKSHEDSLLEKFRELLNAKKLKIRDQQRLLMHAKTNSNSKHATNTQVPPQVSKPHTPSISQPGKRKAPKSATASQSSEDDSFERKAPIQKEESDGSQQINTPEVSDPDVTEEESDDDLDSAPRPNLRPDKITGGSENADNMDIDTLMPARDLPFEKPDTDVGKTQIREPASDKLTLNQEAGNADEETDDDEL